MLGPRSLTGYTVVPPPTHGLRVANFLFWSHQAVASLTLAVPDVVQQRAKCSVVHASPILYRVGSPCCRCLTSGARVAQSSTQSSCISSFNNGLTHFGVLERMQRCNEPSGVPWIVERLEWQYACQPAARCVSWTTELEVCGCKRHCCLAPGARPGWIWLSEQSDLPPQRKTFLC